MGFFASFIFFVIGFFTAYQLVETLFLRKAPEVTKSTFFDTDPLPANINSSELGMAFGL